MNMLKGKFFILLNTLPFSRKLCFLELKIQIIICKSTWSWPKCKVCGHSTKTALKSGTKYRFGGFPKTMLTFNNSQKGHIKLTQSHYMHDYSLLQGKEKQIKVKPGEMNKTESESVPNLKLLSRQCYLPKLICGNVPTVLQTEDVHPAPISRVFIGDWSCTHNWLIAWLST